MPPYDARGDGNGDKRHRAVLIGVDGYTHMPDLPGVARSMELMAEALSGRPGGVLDGDALVRVVNPAGPPAVQAALATARDEVDGLLIVYFAGHGLVRTDGSDLHLMVSDSKVTSDRNHPFVDALSWRNDVMSPLRHAKADWVVVILDCCYAGNALSYFQPRAHQSFAVLTAAEEGVEIPPGTGPEGTPFTVEVHRILTTGVAGGGPVTFMGLVAEVRNALARQPAVDNHRWIPDERRHGDDVVLSLVRRTPLAPPVTDPVTGPGTGPRSRPPEPGRTAAVRRWSADGRRGARAAVRWLGGVSRRTAVLVLAVVALATAGGAVGLVSCGNRAACEPPLELRLLTDPDVRPTVQKAADVYLRRHTGRCRATGITVYDAKATDTVAAFRSATLWRDPPAACPATGDCFRPERDLGAQPDIWIPGVSSTWQRARTTAPGGGTAPSSTGTANDGTTVTLDRLGSVAFSPIVLAVPTNVPVASAMQTNYPLSALIGQLHQGPGNVEILRADPEVTDDALLATVSLYASQGSDSGGIEQVMQKLSPAPRTARDLLCALADGSHNSMEDRAAVLVPEHVMAQFNLTPSDAGRPSCATATLSARTALYPSDVPMLDLPFIRVTWKGADRQRAERAAAVEDFHRWLTTPEAQRIFTMDGYRGLAEDGQPALPGSAATSLLTAAANARAVRSDVLPAFGPPATATVLTDTLRRYRRALGPGRVLYLLDDSTSMSTNKVWDYAKDLVARSMGSLGTRDEYGVRGLVPASGNAHRDLLPLGAQQRAAAQRQVGAAGPVDKHSDPEKGLQAAMTELRARSKGDGRPMLIVLLTDGEDPALLTEHDLSALVDDVRRSPRVRIVTVVLQGGGCAPGTFGRRVTDASGGRCLESSADLATRLTDEVARTGTGDAE